MNLEYDFTYRSNPQVSISVFNPTSGSYVNRLAFIDTGADVTMLDAGIAADIGLHLLDDAGANVRGIGGARTGLQVAEVQIHLLESPNLSVLADVAFVADLEETLGNLIGLDILAHFDVALSHGRNSGSIGRTFRNL